MATPDNQLFGSSRQPEISVYIFAAHITGIQPSRFRPDSPVVRVVQIAVKDIGSFKADITYLVRNLLKFSSRYVLQTA